jgi:phospholipid/cholesterol/gamma-HCH transport system substrate-binding protein
MSRNIVETVLGAVVLVVAVGFLVWAYGRSDAGDPGGYALRAKFERVDGLDVGGDVRISGIKVGQVLGQRLDPVSFRAEDTFSVRQGIELPADSSAAVVSSGLLGGKYLALVPGGDDRALKDGDEITLTQSSVNLEDLIGRYIFSGQSGGQGQGQGQGGAQPPAAPGTAGQLP